jgi:hypothetical protein
MVGIYREDAIMPSCEILINNINMDFSKLEYKNFALTVSCPAQSHRDPSLWQHRFNKNKGTLLHIGETRFKGQDDWFFCYDLLLDIGLLRFKFKPEVWGELKKFIDYLMKTSENKKIIFTTDYQFGGKKFIYKPMKLKKFIKLHDTKGLKFNSWIEII